MADFLRYDEGAKYLLTSGDGLPSTCRFLLSTKPCSGAGTHVVGDTLAGGVGEITGTGYARQSQAAPTPGSTGTVSFSQMTFATGSATDWPASVKSVVLVTTADNSGKAICAWNLLVTKAAGAVTVTIASPAVFTFNSHGLVAGDAVVFTTTGALPTGLTAGTVYYVIATGLTTNNFEVATTVGGAAVNTSGTQSGTHTCTPQVAARDLSQTNTTEQITPTLSLS